jgi:hypothetical protein
MMKGLVALAFLCVAAAVWAGYLPKGNPAAGGATNFILIYNASYNSSGVDTHRNWKQPDFILLLAHATLSGYPLGPMFEKCLVLALRAQSTRGFVSGFGTGPSKASDWTRYAESRLFGGDEHLRLMDAAAGQVKGTLNAPERRVGDRARGCRGNGGMPKLADESPLGLE